MSDWMNDPFLAELMFGRDDPAATPSYGGDGVLSWEEAPRLNPFLNGARSDMDAGLPSNVSTVLAPKPAGEVDGRGISRDIGSAKTILRQFGLDGLIPIVDGWIRGGMSWEEAQVQLLDLSTDAGKTFDARFPAIRLRRQAGKPALTAAEIVNYEKNATDILRAAGLPQGFYDTKDDFTDLLVKDVSLNELNQRVNNGFAAVAKAPAQVREAFSQFFGANGDAALASYFLDGEKALPMLTQAVATAEVGGAGLQFGYGLGQQRAEQLARTGVDYGKAVQGFDNLSSLRSVFDETISESVDLTEQGTGVDAVFNLDGGQAKKQVQDRVDQRKAAFGGAGGAAAGQQGVFGLGDARS